MYEVGMKVGKAVFSASYSSHLE